MVSAAPQTHTIRIQLKAINQLFNSLDPSPFHERDLEPDAEVFITEWASESPTNARVCLELSLSSPIDTEEQSRVTVAVQGYFRERVAECGRELHRLMADGRLSLAIGLLFLGVCLFLSNLTDSWNGSVGRLISESLLIGGWVAMWRPLEIFLYRWWPIIRQRSLFRRLANMKVQFMDNMPQAK
jgi:hypothetical protein